MRTSLAFGCALVLLASGMAGCNRGPDRTAVNGAVTYKGQPVSGALITFRPVAGTDGPSAVTPIVDGRYDFSSGNGPIVGKYDVVIRVTDESAGHVGPQKKAAKSTAPAAVDKPPVGSAWMLLEVEIPPGSMVKDFDLDPALMNVDPRASDPRAPAGSS